jgi:hypothetical protein
MPIKTAILGVDPGSPMFAPTFDTLEIYNGHHLSKMPADGERLDGRVEYILKDWMNFLSFGFRVVPTGVSDTHQWFSAPGALPRTLVRVPDDSQNAIMAGVEDAVITTLLGRGGAPRDVVVTNGPFMKFTVDNMGIGGTVAHASSATPLQIHLEVQAPVWMPVETIEVFANNSYDIPTPKGMEEAPLVPAICFTSRSPATTRCSGAIGGARALGQPTKVQTVPGQQGSIRLEYTLDVSDVTPDQLLARNRAGASGKDLWLVARTQGSVGLFPMIPAQVTGDAGALVTDLSAALVGNGIPALAFTNAIFVDVDGNGWRGPFQP